MADNLRMREGDQPLPTPNGHPGIQDLVIADIKERRRLGISRYGTLLQPYNGRDSLRDLYEELLDAATYARQLIYENERADGGPAVLMRLDCCVPGCLGRLLITEDLTAEKLLATGWRESGRLTFLRLWLCAEHADLEVPEAADVPAPHRIALSVRATSPAGGNSYSLEHPSACDRLPYGKRCWFDEARPVLPLPRDLGVYDVVMRNPDVVEFTWVRGLEPGDWHG